MFDNSAIECTIFSAGSMSQSSISTSSVVRSWWYARGLKLSRSVADLISERAINCYVSSVRIQYVKMSPTFSATPHQRPVFSPELGKLASSLQKTGSHHHLQCKKGDKSGTWLKAASRGVLPARLSSAKWLYSCTINRVQRSQKIAGLPVQSMTMLVLLLTS